MDHLIEGIHKRIDARISAFQRYRSRRKFEKHYARIDAKYRKRLRDITWSMVVATSSFMLAACVYFFNPLPTNTINLSISTASFLLALASLLFARRAYLQRVNLLDAIRPDDGDEFYSLSWPPDANDQFQNHKDLFESLGCWIKSIQPCKEDGDLGFKPVNPQMGCEEPAISSAKTDGWLLTQPRIDYIPTRDDKHCTYLGEVSQSQWRFLYARVADSKKTDNDAKFRIVTSFGDPSKKKVQIQKCYYFDGLLTNEAFRSVLLRRRRGAHYAGEVEFDFRNRFDLGSPPIMPALGMTQAGSHVGVSTLVLSADGIPKMFVQQKNQNIGEGRFVVTGSGSVDWLDSKRNLDKRDFLQLIRYSMFREYFEEGQNEEFRGEQKKIESVRRKIDASRILAKDILVIGYFRWVSRMGKPEFLGVYRSKLKASEIRADGKEVVEPPPWFRLPKIEKIGDLVSLKDKLNELANDSANPMRLTLSSAMTIHRLAEIAESAREDEKRALSRALGLSVS